MHDATIQLNWPDSAHSQHSTHAVRRTAARRRTSASPLLLPALLAVCVALPFVFWQYSRLTGPLLLQPTRQDSAPLLTPLQRLQQQKAAEHSSATDSSTQGTKQHTEPHAHATPEQLSAAQDYLRSITHPQPRPAVPAAKYVIDPEPYDMRQQHKQVQAYLASPDFAARQAARKAGGGRGIIINAGGPRLLSTAMVTIKVLREVLNCSLPIELAWHSSSEMDAATLAALQADWGPIRGVDLSAVQWPAHHRRLPGPTNEDEGLPSERAALKQQGFLFKVWSLAASSFASALLLDADNLPLANPKGLWDDASFRLHGNLFWPDFWPPGTSSEAREVVHDMVGLEAQQAQALLSAGKGPPGISWRATESGQVLIDLLRHGDVAEWALWINSFGDTVYRGLWGDKDTYALAFGVAGKAHMFNQLQVAPAGAFSWRPGSVLVKATEAHMDGWQLAGMVQYDAWGSAAFLHRTMNKLSCDGEPWAIGLLTAPLPLSWIQYYLSLDALGPTVGVPVTYAAPASAFNVTRMSLPRSTTPSTGTTSGKDGSTSSLDCPTATFNAYWALRQQAVPVGPLPGLDAACRSHLTSLLGSGLAAAYDAAQLTAHPELLAVGWGVQDSKRPQPQHYGFHATEPPDASPVLAWALPTEPSGGRRDSSVTRVAHASYAALAWVKQHSAEFALLGGCRGGDG